MTLALEAMRAAYAGVATATAGVVTQQNAKYQDKPKGPAHCSLCNYWIPGPKPEARGSCKQVAGSIAPQGWCQFYAKNPKAKA